RSMYTISKRDCSSDVCSSDLENGQVEIRLSSDLATYLLQLKSDYTQYRLFDTVQLDSKYSIRLYKLMREANKDKGKTCPTLQASPKELIKMMGAPKS